MNRPPNAPPRSRASRSYPSALAAALTLTVVLVAAQGPSRLYLDRAYPLYELPYQFTVPLAGTDTLVYVGSYATPNARTTTFEFGYADATSGEPLTWRRVRSSNNEIAGLKGFGADGAGNVYVLGTFVDRQQVDFEQVQANGVFADADGRGYYIAKYSPRGALLWHHVVAEADGVTVLDHLAVTPGGRIVALATARAGSDLDLNGATADRPSLPAAGATAYASVYDLDFRYLGSELLGDASEGVFAQPRRPRLIGEALVGELRLSDVPAAGGTFDGLTVLGQAFGAGADHRRVGYRFDTERLEVASTYYDPRTDDDLVGGFAVGPDGRVYVAAFDPAGDSTWLTGFRESGTAAHEAAVDGRVDLHAVWDGGPVVTVAERGLAWRVDGAPAEVDAYDVGELEFLRGVLALGPDLRPRYGGVLNATSVYEVAGELRIGFGLQAARGPTVIEPGPVPYVTYDAHGASGQSFVGEGVLDTVCRPVADAQLPDSSVACVSFDRWQLDLTAQAEGTGLRWQWHFQGDPLGDDYNDPSFYYVAGSRTERLVRDVRFEDGYAAVELFAVAHDGCGGVDTTNVHTAVALAPADVPRSGVQEDLVFPGRDTVLSWPPRHFDYPDALAQVQWYRGGFALEDGPKYAGTRTRALTIRDLTHEDDGVYALVTDVPACGYDADLRGVRLRRLRVLQPRLHRAAESDFAASLGAPFPNPSAGRLWLPNATGRPVDGEARLTDGTGRLVFASRVTLPPGGATELRLPRLPAGVYALTVRSDDGRRAAYRILLAPDARP